MKIAYLSRAIIPSMEANSVHIMKMCSAFCRQGASVVLVHEGDDLTELAMDESEVNAFYGADSRTERVRLASRVPIGKVRLHAFRAARVAARQKVDLAYCRDVLSCASALQRRIRSVIELHSLPGVDSQTGKTLQRIFQDDALYAVVVITESLKLGISQLYNLDSSKIIVCPDAADDLSQCTPAKLDDRGKIRVGYLGSMLPGKGMEIIAELPALCPEMSFHVVGGTPEQVTTWQSRFQNRDNIRFHGHVPPAQAGNYIAAFDIALAPNQESVIVKGGTDIGRFTSPLKLFEYMSAGKAIIASDLPVLREVLQHDRNAWLCEAASPEKWRDAILRLAANPEIAMRLSAAAQQDFAKFWSWDARATRLKAQIFNQFEKSINSNSM